MLNSSSLWSENSVYDQLETGDHRYWFDTSSADTYNDTHQTEKKILFEKKEMPEDRVYAEEMWMEVYGKHIYHALRTRCLKDGSFLQCRTKSINEPSDYGVILSHSKREVWNRTSVCIDSIDKIKIHGPMGAIIYITHLNSRTGTTIL